VSSLERQPHGRRLTKKERAASAREKIKTEKAREGKPSRKRTIIAVASGFGVPVLIGIVALSQHHDPGLTTPTSTPGIVRTETPEVTKQDEQMLIQRAVEKRGVKLSQREQELWQGFGPLPPIDGENAAPEFIRFRETLKRMSQSKNPYFQESAALLTSLINNHDANVIFGRNLIFRGESVATAVNPTYLPNKIHWNIAISSQLFQGHPLNLPLSLTHDAKLINNQRAFINGLGTLLPMQKKLALAKQRFDTPDTLLLREMSGYAAQAEAHIYALGLMGDRALTRSGHDTITLGFIRSGEKSDSLDWQSFLLMRYPKMRKGWSLN